LSLHSAATVPAMPLRFIPISASHTQLGHYQELLAFGVRGRSL
jgi:hypothetical protein